MHLGNSMADQEMIQEKIGEALGLEKAAQKAVAELDSRGLLKPEHVKKLSSMKDEARQQEEEMRKLVEDLAESEGFDQQTIEDKAEETAEKASKIMETYLGDQPDTQEALEFLCLAEGGEVIHYEALNTMAQGIKNTQVTDTVQSILEEEKKHLMQCIQLVRQNAASSSA